MTHEIIPPNRGGMQHIFRLAVIVVASIVLVSGYAGYLEPNYLWITQKPIKIAGVSTGQSIKIVHLSDIHTKTFSRPDYLVEKVNSQKPDIIVITGDVFDGRLNDLTYMERYLAPLEANYGKYFVYGNNEYIGKVDMEGFSAHLEKAGYIILRNNNVKLDLKGQTLWLIGVDDPHTGRDNLAKAMQGVGEGPKVLLAHSPEIIDDAVREGIDLVLVGHTHGGQVRLPGAGNIIVNVRPGYEEYLRGLYKVGRTQMYVNRGIGTTRLPMRLFVPPEIAVFDLQQARE